MFINALDYCEVGEKGGKTIYRLNNPLVYQSKNLGKIIVPTFFYTDLASVPRVPLIYMIWGNRAHREAVLHDFLYRKDAKPQLSFSEANNIFKEAMISRGQPFYIYHPMWLGVTLGGKSSYHRMNVMDKFKLDVEYH